MKTAQLQIRLTPEEKARLKQRAAQAGQDLSAFVLSRVLPDGARRFEAVIEALRHGRTPDSIALAELNDLLSGASAGELVRALDVVPTAGGRRADLIEPEGVGGYRGLGVRLAGPGRLEGRVVERATGAGIAGVDVELLAHPPAGRDLIGRVLRMGKTRAGAAGRTLPIARVRSGADGGFRL